MYKTFKKLEPMSAQQLVDCSKDFSNSGCQGGTAFNSLHYLIAHGTMKSTDYPYTGSNGDCKYNTTRKFWEIDSCTKIASNNISSLKSAILQQPVIVSFDTSDSKFSSYSKGVYSGNKGCGGKLNHNLLVVGWG